MATAIVAESASPCLHEKQNVLPLLHGKKNQMLMLGPCDSDSRTSLLVYIRSLAVDQERNYHRKKEYNQNKKKENETAWKPCNQSYQQGWKSSGYQGREDYGGGYASQSDSSYRWYSQKR